MREAIVSYLSHLVFLRVHFVFRVQDTFTMECPDMNRDRFPHSDTAGSQDRDSFPASFAAMRVLLRYLAPRHPLSALVKDFVFCETYVSKKTITPIKSEFLLPSKSHYIILLIHQVKLGKLVRSSQDNLWFFSHKFLTPALRQEFYLTKLTFS